MKSDQGCAVQCINHEDRTASARCGGCAEAYCPTCLVEAGGKSWCTSCKVLAIDPSAVGKLGTVATLSSAKTSFILACVAVGMGVIPMCGDTVGGVLCIVSLIKGIEAMKAIRENPQLGGEGMAMAGILVSFCRGGVSGAFLFAATVSGGGM